MAQDTQEIMESIIENVNYSAVETMESEDIREVQYVYDESQMILDGTDNFNNITDLVLEDGTRAMIVNGTLMTADGQTLIIQDDSDLSQYYVDENTDQILLSEGQEEQFLELMSPQNSQTQTQVVRYVQGGNNGTPPVQEEVVYIHEDNNVWPAQEQYQLAEVDSENGAVPMQVVKLENQQIIDGVDGVIDLEQFLNQQGLVQLEGMNYQYAVLKDGKFHIQTIDDTASAEILKDQNNSAEAILGPSPETSLLDLTAIRGKDTNTGEPLTLSKYVNKVSNIKCKKRDFSSRNAKNKTTCQDKPILNNTSASTNVALKHLINRKITIGKTDKGKLLVGKILNVTKKTEANSNNLKNNKNSSERNITVKKKIILPSKENKKKLFNVKEAASLVDEDDIDMGEPSENEKSYAQADSSKLPPVPRIESRRKNNTSMSAVTSSNSELLQTTNTTLRSALKPVSNAHSLSQNKTKGTEDISQNPTMAKNSPGTAASPELSKIVIHKKVVTKDCFDVITRTLVGLMNMESVVKKLRNKIIIIKIIEKTYNLDSSGYAKSISYCTGYMVREYKLDEEANNFSETWKFIPDSNAQDTILGEDNLETVVQDPSAAKNNLKQIANLTIQITINSQGNRTTRVIINPPNMYKCKECPKSFRTSSALKVHTSEQHTSTVSVLECTVCAIKFKSHQEWKEHFLIHQADDNQGMYECMECNKRFGSSLLLRKHMEMHFKPVNCSHCNRCFSNIRDLKKHLTFHEPPVHQPHPPSVPTILKKGSQDSAAAAITAPNPKPQEQKIYCCHICGRQFSRHSNLQRHIEIHQGEGAMYKCAICNCSYHYVSSLTRHVVTCHVDITRRSQNVENQVSKEEPSTQSDMQFVDQIVEMIPLEGMNGENLQYVAGESLQYVTGAIGNLTQNFTVEQGVEILHIPVDEGGVILEN